MSSSKAVRQEGDFGSLLLSLQTEQQEFGGLSAPGCPTELVAKPFFPQAIPQRQDRHTNTACCRSVLGSQMALGEVGMGLMGRATPKQSSSGNWSTASCEPPDGAGGRGQVENGLKPGQGGPGLGNPMPTQEKAYGGVLKDLPVMCGVGQPWEVGGERPGGPSPACGPGRRASPRGGGGGPWGCRPGAAAGRR